MDKTTKRTKIFFGIAPTLSLVVQVTLWAVLEGVVSVS